MVRLRLVPQSQEARPQALKPVRNLHAAAPRKPAAPAGGRPGPARGLSLHARHPSRDVPGSPLDDPAIRRLRRRPPVEPALPVPDRARHDRPLGRVRPPHADGLRLRPSVGPGRSRPGRRRRVFLGGHGDAPRRDPAGQGLGVHDHQRDGRGPAGLLRRRGAPPGFRRQRVARHCPERHPQGIHRARNLHLSAARIHARRHGHHRLDGPGSAALERHLDQRLPHAGSGSERRPGTGVHPRQRHRLHRCRAPSRPRGRRLRAAPVVLLQFGPPFPGRDRQVPRRPAPVRAPHAGALRGPQPALAPPPLPHADGGLDAQRAAARGERRADGLPGPRGRAGRHAVAAYQFPGRGAGPAERVGRDAGVADAAGHRARIGRDQHGRPARRFVLRRGPHLRPGGRSARVPRGHRRVRRHGRGHRAGLCPARDPGKRLRLPAAGRAGRGDDRGRERLSGGRG